MSYHTLCICELNPIVLHRQKEKGRSQIDDRADATDFVFSVVAVTQLLNVGEDVAWLAEGFLKRCDMLSTILRNKKAYFLASYDTEEELEKILVRF